MLFQIAQMPPVKLCKVLTADKITQKSEHLAGFPKSYNEVASSALTKPSEALTDAVWRMIRACLSDDGIGLAAPQIGIFKQVFVIRENEDSFRAYFHPQYTVDPSSKQEVQIEGCLSVPGKRIPVFRETAINTKWLDFENEKLVVRSMPLKSLMARVFQHEYAHLLGESILKYLVKTK